VKWRQIYRSGSDHRVEDPDPVGSVPCRQNSDLTTRVPTVFQDLLFENQIVVATRQSRRSKGADHALAEKSGQVTWAKTMTRRSPPRNCGGRLGAFYTNPSMTSQELLKLFRARNEKVLLAQYQADENLRFQWMDAFPPLLLAVEKGFLELTPLLLRQGEDPNVRNACGNTGLHLVCTIRRETRYTLKASVALEMGKLLADSGCRCNQLNNWGQNAVNFGTEYYANYGVEGARIVEFLLSLGEDPNLPDDQERAALHNLANLEDYWLEVYQALIDGGGDLRLLDKGENTPFELFQQATEYGSHIHAPRELYESIRDLLNPESPESSDDTSCLGQ
jgi:hypothetical protein